MDNFKLAPKICQAIVDGTLSGYLNYLDERRKKKDEMNVSGAYAWTKGNHIDDQISKLAKGQGLSFIPDKAGYTWDYLKFILNEQNENYLIIIKNSKRIQQTFDGKELKDDNYLVEFSDINTAPFKNAGVTFIERPEQIQLELNDPEEIQAVFNKESLKVTQKYDRFYVVTYEIDEQSKDIKSILLTMPNRETMSLVEIDDLTEYIVNSSYEITAEALAPILNDKSSEATIFSGDDNAFGFAEIEHEQEGNQ